MHLNVGALVLFVFALLRVIVISIDQGLLL